ncbi:hypothetical protein AMTR_s00105p00044780 [Amborella trichopoda]|uniref:Uncharacterized protein n=1 Tax=Amborella trichopoda TaxID=13333 RepID=W1NWL1_AMBTC|nr:hypothetical protein AMTR_s00105p00044780 [Amborella trichopoda]
MGSSKQPPKSTQANGSSLEDAGSRGLSTEGAKDMWWPWESWQESYRGRDSYENGALDGHNLDKKRETGEEFQFPTQEKIERLAYDLPLMIGAI